MTDIIAVIIFMALVISLVCSLIYVTNHLNPDTRTKQTLLASTLAVLMAWIAANHLPYTTYLQLTVWIVISLIYSIYVVDNLSRGNSTSQKALLIATNLLVAWIFFAAAGFEVHTPT